MQVYAQGDVLLVRIDDVELQPEEIVAPVGGAVVLAEGELAEAEIAHEVLLREWPTLKRWLSDESEFLAWKGEVEYSRRQGESVPKRYRASVLLMGRRLEQAESWLAHRPEDIGSAERYFIHESLRHRRKLGHALALLVGLAFLCVVVQPLGILYFSPFRAGLIDARVQNLLVQGQQIAVAVASEARDSEATNIDPERLLEPQAGESYSPSDDTPFEFPVNPERVAPLLRRLFTFTNYARARIYDRDGTLILDSRSLYGRGDVLRFDLPPPTAERPGIAERTFTAIRIWLDHFPRYRELGPENGKGYPEVAQALDGQMTSVVRVSDRGEVIVLVAVPIQRFRALSGALLLSTLPGDIDGAVAAEQAPILKMLAFSLMMGLLSSWLAFRTMRWVAGRSSKEAAAAAWLEGDSAPLGPYSGAARPGAKPSRRRE
jgi:hypothetical protein